MKQNDYKNLMEKVVPSTALIQETKHKMKGKPIMKKQSLRIAIVAAAMLIFATTAFAAWNMLKPSEVADLFDNHALSAAFESETAINIIESKTSGDYIFTLMAVVSGKDITDMLYYSDNVQNERTYAVVAIQYADGTPMPGIFDDAYGQPPFFISPLIKGLTPWHFNIVTMNGGYAENIVDGVMYRLIELDDVTIFAEYGLYFAVCSGTPFYSIDAFIYNEQTGEITANPEYSGVSAIFNLPVDKSLADPIKAEQYISDFYGDDIGNEPDIHEDQEAEQEEYKATFELIFNED
jgi:hypothetical protein